jgi:hypothetical protein
MCMHVHTHTHTHTHVARAYSCAYVSMHSCISPSCTQGGRSSQNDPFSREQSRRHLSWVSVSVCMYTYMCGHCCVPLARPLSAVRAERYLSVSIIHTYISEYCYMPLARPLSAAVREHPEGTYTNTKKKCVCLCEYLLQTLFKRT